MSSTASEVRTDVHLLMGVSKEKQEATVAALSRKGRVKEAAAIKVAEAQARLAPAPPSTPEEVTVQKPSTSFTDSMAFRVMVYGAGALAGIVLWRVARGLIWSATGKATAIAKEAAESVLTDAVDASASYVLNPQVQKLLEAYRAGSL